MSHCKNKRILVISDLHVPYHHKHSFKFLAEIKKQYKPDFVVNIGDSMARWTNDRWVSTLHRVVNPPRDHADSERLSVAYFHASNYDAEINCLETCKSKNNPAKYESIHYAAYYIEKLMKSRQTVTV